MTFEQMIEYPCGTVFKLSRPHGKEVTADIELVRVPQGDYCPGVFTKTISVDTYISNYERLSDKWELVK